MASLNFNTENQTFRQIMGNGLSYKVPPFQRDYSWDRDDWEDLWQDIIALLGDDPESAHYMGYLALQSTDNRQFDIIDGQHRITTLNIMMLAAVACLKNLSQTDGDDNALRAEQIKKRYISQLDPIKLVPQPKIRLNRHNDDFYQSYLVPLEKTPQRNLNASEHLLQKSFVWFKDKIKAHAKDDGKSVARFIDRVVDNLFFTVFIVTDELNAFKVFETLNARGVRLSSTDLLKNYLFSVAHKDGAHDTEIKALEDRWERITGVLEAGNFPEFLRGYWNNRNQLVRKFDLFKVIRHEIRNKNQAFNLIQELDVYADTYQT